MALGISLFFLALMQQAIAQEISFRDTIQKFNRARIMTNARGAEVEYCWGAANIGLGVAGTLEFKEQDTKDFYQMSIICGALNTGLGAFRMAWARKQAKEHPDGKTAYAHFVKDRRNDLINMGIDKLIFDNVLFASHQKYHSRWAQIAEEMRISGNGISFGF